MASDTVSGPQLCQHRPPLAAGKAGRRLPLAHAGFDSSSGVWGNPDAASAVKVERLLAAISEQIAAKLTNKELWALPYLSNKVEP